MELTPEMTAKLEGDLERFTGTEKYYKHLGKLVFTDGIRFLAENADCFWLINIVASYQWKLEKVPFQLWQIKVLENKSAVITCKEDSDKPDIIKQEIKWTDFPFKEFECYCIDNVMLLKSEY